MPNNLTDKEIKKALECAAAALMYDDEQNLYKLALDLINRYEEKIKKFENRQKPTGASGYKIENGKVVFFTNMLGGCKIVKENLEEVVKTLNELLQEAYAKDEIAFALKCKTEEIETLKAEVERLNTYLDVIGYSTDKIKAEAYKEFAERLKAEMVKSKYVLTVSPYARACNAVIDFWATEIDNLLNELVGKKDANL